MNENKLEITIAHCNSCLRETKHYVIAVRHNSRSAPATNDPYCEDEISWSTTYRMLECCGCENILLHRTYWFSEYDDVEEEYYPPQISRQLPKWHDELPEEWYELLKEVYTALHADSRRFALMGTRALVDLYMTEQLRDIGRFKQKIEKLETDGLISKQNKVVLEVALDAGHAAIHRGYIARPNEVNQVIDIIENLLQSHVLKSAAKNLKLKTPPRSKK